MELRHLRYFIAVAEELHFGHAALRLRVAQPSLSRQIRQLEEEVRAQLFERSGRGVRLTAAGSEFLHGARETLAFAEGAARDARRAAATQLVNLSVAFAPSILQSAQASIGLARLRERIPGAHLEVLPLCSPDQWTALRSRRIQVGVLYQPPADPAFSAEPLWDVGLLAAVPRGHRFAAAASLTLEQFAEEPLVWFERSSGPRVHDLVRAAFDSCGRCMNVAHSATTESSRLALVASGLGVTLVAGASGRAIPGVELRPVADLREKLVVYAVHEAAQAPPIVTALVGELRASGASRFRA